MFHAGKTDRGDPRKGPPSLLSHLSAQEGGDAGGEGHFLSGKIPGGTFKKDRFVSLGRETFLSATQRDYALATLRPI